MNPARGGTLREPPPVLWEPLRGRPPQASSLPPRIRTRSSSEPNTDQTPNTDCPRHWHRAESTGTRERVRTEYERVHTPPVRTVAPKPGVFDQSSQGGGPPASNENCPMKWHDATQYPLPMPATKPVRRFAPALRCSSPKPCPGAHHRLTMPASRSPSRRSLRRCSHDVRCSPTSLK